MRKPLLLLLAVCLLALATHLACRRIDDSPAPAPTASTPATPTRSPSSSTPRSAGRASRPADPATLARARDAMGSDARNGSCGPYALLTDVTDAALLAACERIGSSLDRIFAERFGVAPADRPREALLLFADLAAYRSFVQQDRGAGAGYSGYARGAAGFLVTHADGRPGDEVASTLAHELTHLVERRVLGPGLPPWLSEGLAEAIGDTADASGLSPLAGLRGAEPMADRLRAAVTAGHHPDLARLTTARRAEFDKTIPSWDYETSALLVRYLLTDPHQAPPFRAYLRSLSQGAQPDTLLTHLKTDWPTLTQSFLTWLMG